MQIPRGLKKLRPSKQRIAVDVTFAGSQRQIAGFPDLW